MPEPCPGCELRVAAAAAAPSRAAAAGPSAAPRGGGGRGGSEGLPSSMLCRLLSGLESKLERQLGAELGRPLVGSGCRVLSLLWRGGNPREAMALPAAAVPPDGSGLVGPLSCKRGRQVRGA